MTARVAGSSSSRWRRWCWGSSAAWRASSRRRSADRGSSGSRWWRSRWCWRRTRCSPSTCSSPPTSPGRAVRWSLIAGLGIVVYVGALVLLERAAAEVSGDRLPARHHAGGRDHPCPVRPRRGTRPPAHRRHAAPGRPRTVAGGAREGRDARAGPGAGRRAGACQAGTHVRAGRGRARGARWHCPRDGSARLDPAIRWRSGSICRTAARGTGRRSSAPSEAASPSRRRSARR